MSLFIESLTNKCEYEYNYVYITLSLVVMYSLIEYIFKSMREIKEKALLAETTANTTRGLFFSKQKEVNEKIEELFNRVAIIDEQINKIDVETNLLENSYKQFTNMELKRIKLDIKSVYNETQKHDKLIQKKEKETEFVLLGHVKYNLTNTIKISVPMFINKNSTNIISDMVTTYNNSLIESNIILSSLGKFSLIKNIELLKLHIFANIVDDNGKIIWGKSEDTLASGYEQVVIYLKDNGIKF